MTHVAWNCDGKKLAAVGIDKITRVWAPEKSVSTFATGDQFTALLWSILKMEMRAASNFSGGHSDDVDYISWNPTHPDLFCTSSQKDRRIVFWDARRMSGFDSHKKKPPIDSRSESRYIQQCPVKISPVQTSYSPDGRSLLFASAGHQLFFMTLGKEGEETKEQWHVSDKDAV